MLKTLLVPVLLFVACYPVPGPPGPEGPPGPVGPTGGDAVIADGSITREKLARESVLPEHRGRSNSVVSFVILSPSSPAGIPRSTGPIYTVPAGKNLVLTDFMLAATDNNGVIYVVDFKVVGGPVRARLFFGPNPNLSNKTMESGVRFAGGETFELITYPSFQSPTNPLASMEGTVAGYEY